MPNLPGWDSLDAVSRYHSWAEILGIVFLGLLVVSEFVAYRYSHRKDELVAIAESASRDQQAQKDREHEAATAQLRQQLANAEARRQPRHLDRDKFLALVKHVEKFNLVIKAGTGEGDERAYANEIAAALATLGWRVPINDVIHAGPDVSGIWMTMKGTPGSRPPLDVVAFLTSLKSSGASINPKLIMADAGVPDGEVWLCIGRKR